MGVLGKFGPAALKYYSSILNSAYQHLNVSNMWDAIHRVQDNYGLPTAQASGADVMVIRGFANRIVNGARNLLNAAPTDTITSDMMATGAYTIRDANAIATTPIYQVRGISVVQKPDGTVTGGWFTTVFTAAQMPDTVGGLDAAMFSDAEQHAAAAAQQTGGESGGTVLVTGNYEITVV